MCSCGVLGIKGYLAGLWGIGEKLITSIMK